MVPYRSASKIEPGVIVVKVSFTDLVCLVGYFIQLHHEGQVGQPPCLHLRRLHRVPVRSVNGHLKAARSLKVNLFKVSQTPLGHYSVYGQGKGTGSLRPICLRSDKDCYLLHLLITEKTILKTFPIHTR